MLVPVDEYFDRSRIAVGRKKIRLVFIAALLQLHALFDGGSELANFDIGLLRRRSVAEMPDALRILIFIQLLRQTEAGAADRHQQDCEQES